MLSKLLLNEFLGNIQFLTAFSGSGFEVGLARIPTTRYSYSIQNQQLSKQYRVQQPLQRLNRSPGEHAADTPSWLAPVAADRALPIPD